MPADQSAPPPQQMTVEQALNTAMRHHGAGQLAEAEDSYRQVLDAQPKHPAALHLLGVIAHQMDNNDAAVDLITQALAIKPDYAEACSNLGLALQDLERLDEAVASYRKALAIKPDYAEAHYNLGNALRDLERLDEAIASFDNALAINPDYVEAHCNLGNSLQDLERLDEAVESYRSALAVKPNFVEVHISLGSALQDLERLDEAVASYHAALTIEPDFVDAHCGLGTALQSLQRHDEAVESYQTAITIKPDLPEAHNNLGTLFEEQRKLNEAVASYHRAIAINPEYADARYNLGNALQGLERLDEAVASYRKALAINPDHAGAHSSLAMILNSNGQRSEALDHFKRSLDIERGENPVDPSHRSFRFTTKAKMNHDMEQFQYLASKEKEMVRFSTLATVYAAVDKEIDWPNSDTTDVQIHDKHHQRLGDTYNRAIHLIEAPEVTGSSLSDNLDVKKITTDYFALASEMTYFDDFLSPSALASLRRFLLESTIWFDFSYGGGYLGAMAKAGLACPLLLQIADDLRQTFPDIFKDHRMNQLWAYKYDSRLTGIEVHADFTAVNVNFWVTPSSANLNPNSGGLIVYDVEAPLDWNFEAYNRNPMHIRTYLEGRNSNKMVVPHRENRMVMFNSNLFHETDAIDFKPGYENRRINVTMLFGVREN